METPLRLAVDFDGTLHNPHDKLPGYKLGRPMPGAVSAMQKLKKEGAILVIHSIWADTEAKCKAMADWCNYFRIPFDFVTNRKPDCDGYLDDRGLRFTTWEQALKDIATLPRGNQSR